MDNTRPRTNKSNLEVFIRSSMHILDSEILTSVHKLPLSTSECTTSNGLNFQNILQCYVSYRHFKISTAINNLNLAIERNAFASAIFFINRFFGSLFHGFLNGGLFGFVAEQQRQNQ